MIAPLIPSIRMGKIGWRDNNSSKKKKREKKKEKKKRVFEEGRGSETKNRQRENDNAQK